MSEVEVHVDKLSKREKQNSSNMPLKLHLPSEPQTHGYENRGILST